MFRQTVAINRAKGEMTFARACSASRDYVLVRCAMLGDNPDIIGLSEDDRRFIVDDITPMEYAKQMGADLPEIDRTR